MEDGGWRVVKEMDITTYPVTYYIHNYNIAGSAIHSSLHRNVLLQDVD